MGDSDVEGAGGGASAGDSAGNTLLTCAEMLSHMLKPFFSLEDVVPVPRLDVNIQLMYLRPSGFHAFAKGGGSLARS